MTTDFSRHGARRSRPKKSRANTRSQTSIGGWERCDGLVPSARRERSACVERPTQIRYFGSDCETLLCRACADRMDREGKVRRAR